VGLGLGAGGILNLGVNASDDGFNKSVIDAGSHELAISIGNYKGEGKA